MSVVLSISSQVVRGHVGNSAIAPGLRALGYEVWPLPTVLLSNHPGHGAAAGLTVAAPDIAAMLAQLESHGWLEDVDAVLTGYFRDAEQVDVAADLVSKLKAARPHLPYCCDPVLGDDPGGLYVAPPVAEAVRDRLLPLADVIIPNRFELEWLSGVAVANAGDAVNASGRLGVAEVIATSVPDGTGRLANVWCGGDGPVVTAVDAVDGAPHGIGDLFSSLVLGGMLSGQASQVTLGEATAIAAQVLSVSQGRDELDLVAGLEDVDRVIPAIVQPYPARSSVRKTPWVAGVDGCRGGWLVALVRADDFRTFRTVLCSKFSDVLSLDAEPAIIAVDIPIGIPDTSIKGGRVCDNETRARLGARQSSVFSVPSRAAVAETDYWRACSANLEHSDPPRKVSKQCFALFPKIREVDGHITPELQSRVFEVHPELAFWALNGKQPLDLPKKVKGGPDQPGLVLRQKLLEGAGFSSAAFDGSQWMRKDVGPDDIVDALALAWSAARLLKGEAVTLPDAPPRDGRGLRMEINA